MTSRQEQEWFRKFYEGTFLVKGWKSQMRTLTKDFQGDAREALEKRLSALGEKIGWEWAKDNAVRRIDTAQLQEWGERLTTAKKDGPDALTAEIHNIANDVDALLS